MMINLADEVMTEQRPVMEEVVNELGSPFPTTTATEVEYVARQGQVVID